MCAATHTSNTSHPAALTRGDGTAIEPAGHSRGRPRSRGGRSVSAIRASHGSGDRAGRRPDRDQVVGRTHQDGPGDGRIVAAGAQGGPRPPRGGAGARGGGGGGGEGPPPPGGGGGRPAGTPRAPAPPPGGGAAPP